MTNPPTRRGAQCPSELALDQLGLGELSGLERAAVERHVKGCASCTARIEERAKGFAAFRGFDPDRAVARLAEAARGVEPPPALAAAIAAAAAQRPTEPKKKGLFDRFVTWFDSGWTPRLALFGLMGMAAVIATQVGPDDDPRRPEFIR